MSFLIVTLSLHRYIEHVLLTRFLLFGCEGSQLEQNLFSLPVHWGGLGLMMPCVLCVCILTFLLRNMLIRLL